MSIIKTISIVSVFSVLVFAAGCNAKDDNPKAKKSDESLVAQYKCPAPMGGDIDKSLYVDKDGKRIYMCCEGCRSDISNNFDAMVEKLKAMGQKPESLSSKELVAQYKCPAPMGGDINKNLYVDKDGKRIYMCCGGCRTEITNNFDAMIEKLKAMGQKPESL